jgi:hypothetical protein
MSRQNRHRAAERSIHHGQRFCTAPSGIPKKFDAVVGFAWEIRFEE